MSCSNGCSHNEAPVEAPQKRAPRTIREALDRNIEDARKNVEDLCITKAKLEALNVLDHPVELYYKAVF